ncbi:heme ABC transporter ATP-binding protein [Neiella sp. HB171785]|uniref:Heme ABC transporter ATP-binding protein n=1 Tax=Neiella litorisoli TaxID=2771431 RepID=A0A8J6UN21_9GAMM|nr:heme ABC transporter ATP-binding protein [Neiella litorisoli]MBD1391320.1 heme ABC transporter ATP-binding protein [Neiella litorisoli]
MLTVTNISYRAGHRQLLDIDTLTLNGGELSALLGPNGAGKSTLLKAISGDIRATGQIELHGRPINQWPALERAKHVGVLPQQSQLTFPFSAEEVVALGLTPLTLSKQQAQRAIEQVMAETDCLRFAKRSFPSLSGGERQRVQLARVLLQLSQAQTTPLLLLDEPTSAQDLGQQHQILALAQKLAHQRGFAVLAVLHDLNQVLQYCDHCALLESGKLVAQGTPSAVLDTDTIAQYWQHQVERVELANGRVAVF